jgi:phage shock protein PspC (stress-responsive transcriptional regulator)
MTETATYRELRRSRSDRMIAGVCGGLGRYFDVNPAFYRVGFVVLTFFGGAGLLIYGACVLVMPSEGERESIASDVIRNHRQRPVALLGLILAAAAGIALLSHVSIRFHSDTFWALVLVAGGVLLWSQRRPPTPAVSGSAAVPPAPARRSRSVLRILLAVVGAIVLAITVTCVVLASLFLHLSHGVGSRAYAPVEASSLRDSYHIGVGTLDLDLSSLRLPAGKTAVHVEAGVGHVRVIVPPGVTVHAKAHVSWGDASVLGHDENGHNVDADLGPSDAQLEIDSRVGIGQIEVDRAVR